jgi:hypothetical protein
MADEVEVVQTEAPKVDDETGQTVPVKAVPPLPANAEEGEVTRTAGPWAEATIEANVGAGSPVALPTGVADAALGHHTVGENEPVEAMANVEKGISRGALG